MTGENAFRLQASEVALNPEVVGELSVQAALEALAAAVGGGYALGSITDFGAQDAPTSVPADGGTHAVSLVTATPPTWMDNAGNITEAGLYGFAATVDQSVAPTVPGLYGYVAGPLGYGVVPVDLLDLASLVVDLGAYPVAEALLPYAATFNAILMTDVTLVATCALQVVRLGYPS